MGEKPSTDREDTRYPNPIEELLPKRVLVIGGSTGGYGLSSRIVAAYTGGADTINVSFEREPAEKKTATPPGWYNTIAFEQQAQKDGMKRVLFLVMHSVLQSRKRLPGKSRKSLDKWIWLSTVLRVP